MHNYITEAENSAANMLVGLGDGASFDLTAYGRKPNLIDTNSWSYKIGHGAGSVLTIGGILGKAGKILWGLRAADEEVSTGKILKWTEDYLGKDVKVIKNDAGDTIFRNAENTRRIRFDINRTYPHENPHVHIEEFTDEGWIGSRIYPRDFEPR